MCLVGALDGGSSLLRIIHLEYLVPGWYNTWEGLGGVTPLGLSPELHLELMLSVSCLWIPAGLMQIQSETSLGHKPELYGKVLSPKQNEKRKQSSGSPRISQQVCVERRQT